jgi:hypothetical protein
MTFSGIQARIKLNRNELSGAFGDIGTDLPLIVGMLLATDLSMTNVLIVFGVLQIMTALVYGIPMPVQPLKAVALIVITQKISGDIILGGGLAIGLIMLVLSLTGLLNWLNRIIPRTVIRGIQLGLGLQLCLVALKDYIPSGQQAGYILAAAGFLIGILLLGNRRYPPALFILALGAVYIFLFKADQLLSLQISVPRMTLPEIKTDSILTGMVLLALPQIPLSLGNSIFATRQLVTDYFPEKKMNVKHIGLTYSVMNIISPFLGGLPVCHGSGGIAGHYTFGGRTGGSAFIYGLFFLAIGLLFGSNSPESLLIFPKSLLGILLLFEGIALILLVKDIITDKRMFFIATVVGLCAIGLPDGYLVGLVIGTALFYLSPEFVLKHFGKH